MGVETSHGKRRPRVPRPGEGAALVAAVMAAPLRDEKTGRWLPGNKAGRLRALQAVGKRTLVTLNPAKCAPWVRPFVELAQAEVQQIVVECGAEASASLKGFAVAAVNALAMHRAFLAIAVDPDTDEKRRSEALAEARAWLKEHRQSVLSLRAEARAGLPERDNGDGWLDTDGDT